MEERTAADASLPFRVSFIKYDDGSDPARAVNATRKLIQEDRVHLVICCTTTPASLAVNKVIEEERVPNLSLAAAASVIEPADAHRFTFKTPLTDRLMIDHTVDYMVKQGWKQVAFMGLEDSYGEGGWVEFKQIATRKGLEIVAAERSRGDTNFTPQALRVSQKKPDAVYFHAIPPSSALATETLRRVGYKGSGAAWRRLGHAGLHGGRQEGGRRRAGRHLGPARVSPAARRPSAQVRHRRVRAGL